MRIKGEKYVTSQPILDRLVQNHIVIKGAYLEFTCFLEESENSHHRFAFQLSFHAANTKSDLFPGRGVLFKIAA